MAEIVEFKQERMLPQYDLMKKSNVFSDEEVREIIKMRETFEYKIAQQTKSIKSYCEYIAYERNLLSMVNERGISLNVGQIKSMKNSLLNHIKTLYKQSLTRFPGEERLWFNYVKYCKFANYINDGSTGLERMLQYHGDKPTIWLRAAMWEYYEAQNIDRVKDILLRGIQRHPEHPELYMKFFKIMLSEAAKMSSELILENNRESEQSLGLQRVFAIYESSKKKICSIDFLVELLEAATDYPFAKSLQKKIIEDMINLFPRNETLWDTLAQRELKGHHTAYLTENENKKDQMETDTKPEIRTNKTLKQRIALALGIYQSAVREVNTDKMWALYLTAMLELNLDLSTQQELKRKTLGVAFKEAYLAGHMSENHLIHYVELLIRSSAKEEFLTEVLQKATTQFPSCVKLWDLWMRYYMRIGEDEKVYITFRRAINKLAFEAKPLWRLIIQYYLGRPEPGNKIDDIYREAMKQNSPVFDSFRGDYIEWVALSKSIVAARKLYRELVRVPPPSLSLHQKMAAIESVQIKPYIEAWRQCHEYSTLYFGKKQTDVWINYIKFERDFGEPKNMSTLYQRAKNTLPEDLIDNFISEHNLLTTGIF